MGLRIGLVTGEFPPMEGGVGAFTGELAKELSSLGNEIHIITAKKARLGKQGRSFWEPKEPYDIGFAQLHANISRWRWGAMSTIAEISARFDLEVINIQYQAVAYDMHLPAINFLPWRLRDISKTVVTFHDMRVPYLFPKAGRWRRKVVNHLGKSADGAITTNQEDFQQLVENGITADRVRVIPIGSNISVDAPTPEEIGRARIKLGLKTGDHLLGFFGFINQSKGPDLLLQVLLELAENVHLVFIGAPTGSSDTRSNQQQLDQLRSLVSELNLGGRVHWTGYLPDSDVSLYLNAAEIMVMPYRDGVSLRRGTLMAILAHGRPLVTTEPIYPLPELVHGENVWLTPIDDREALSDAINHLLEDTRLQTDIATRAEELSSSFSWDMIANRTADFYRFVLGLESS